MHNPINHRLLSLCIFLSMFTHALTIFMLQHHSVWLSAKAQALSNVSTQKNEALKEAFAYVAKSQDIANKKPTKISYPQQLAMQKIEKKKTEPLDIHPNFSLKESSLTLNTEKAPSCKKTGFDSSLKLDLSNLKMPLPQIKAEKNLSPPRPKNLTEPRSNFAYQKSPTIVVPELPSITYSNTKPSLPSLLNDTTIRRPLLTILASQLPSFPTLDELSTSNYSAFFDIDLVFTPQEDHGYIFAITLIPHEDLNLPKLRQHYCFLIDRANSIQKERLAATKAAVLKAIEDLPSDDTFNIVVFDSKMEKLFSSPQSPNASTIYQAKTFLDQINLGSFFAPADLYNPLWLTLPSQIQDDEVYTAILLTDGQCLSKKSSMKSILQTWTAQNSGRVSLFTLCLGSDPQIATLELASVFNKGRLYYSPTMRGIKRKMTKLMKNIQKPLTKNMSYHAIAKDSNNRITLYPSTRQSSQVYLDQPLVIIGRCESMDDFILFVQGKQKDRYINVKKTISFVNAKKGGSSLKQEWAIQQAYQNYEQYVHDDNPRHLTDAKEWLTPYRIQPAFQ